MSPFSRALLAAAVAHAAAIALLLRSDGPESSPVAAGEPHGDIVELIDLHIDPPAAAMGPDESRAANIETAHGAAEVHGRLRSAARTVARSDAKANPGATAKPRAYDDALDRVGPPLAATESAAAESGRPPANDRRLSLAELGLEGPKRIAASTFIDERLASSERATTERANERISHAMRQLAHEHDRKVGLGAGGAIAAALQRAAYGSNLSQDARATFEVVVMGNAVSTISLIGAEAGGPSAWNEVARKALAQLAGRQVRVRAGSRGVVLRINVMSRVALPSGHDPGLEISVGRVVVQRGQGKRSARLSLFDLRPMFSLEPDRPGMPMRLPQPAGLTVLSTDIDPANLEAHGRQVVHTSTVEEILLD